MRFLLCILLTASAVLSCKKDNSDSSLLQRWQVDSLVEHSDSIARNAVNNIYIEFKSDKSITLELEANTCGGSFSLSDSKNLSIEVQLCTEACCDSDFSTRFTQLLSEIKSYHFVNNQLNLSGEENRSIRLLKAE